MQLEGAREPRGARRGQTGPKRAQKQKRSLAPGCCALAAAAPGEGALQKRRLVCCALAATVRYSRGTTARRRALQPGRRSTAQLQHGAVRCSQGVTARHRALQPGRHSTARRRALQPGHHSTAPCAAAGGGAARAPFLAASFWAGPSPPRASFWQPARSSTPPRASFRPPPFGPGPRPGGRWRPRGVTAHQ